MKNTQDIKLIRDVRLWDKVVLIDGLGRSGKSILSPIIASFENVEIERIEPILERIPVLVSMGKISKDAAIQMLQMEVDMKLYESMIGRNTNFRFKDHSSVFNNPFKLEYIRRLFGKDGNVIVEKILKTKPVFQLVLHDTLRNIDIYYEAFKRNLYVIEIVRDPIDLIYSWYMRGWGGRFTNDPRVGCFTYESKNGIAPWYNLNIDGEYNELSPMDRIIHLIEGNIITTYEKYQSLNESRKNQILWLVYEDFVTNTEDNVVALENFIKINRTKKTSKQLKIERCPRNINEQERKNKYKIIEKEASTKSFNKLDTLYSYYNLIKEVINEYNDLK
jgi:hypothetical protein